jgi:hypothetical protein
MMGRAEDELIKRIPVIRLISKVNRLLLLGLCIWLASNWASAIREAGPSGIKAWDFGEVYYGARCVIGHRDAYNPQAGLREFEAQGGKFPNGGADEASKAQATVTVVIYPPTALLVVAPLAELRWSVALTVWLSAACGLLVLAAFLVWDLAGDAPLLAGCMACFILMNCVVLLWFANPAGIVIPLCVIATWCFIRERFEAAAVVMMAVALLLKPQDSIFVWLYFLLAGGRGRKRAMQTFAFAAALGVYAAIWVAPSSPHWIGEMRSNIAALSAPGGNADPGPSNSRGAGTLINLQAAVSLFKNDPHFYNPVSYLIGGAVVLGWMAAVLRKRPSREGAMLALSAIALLSMTAIYHWNTDAKLLLLTIPSCATLWAGGGVRRWVGLGLTSAAIFVTADVPNLWVFARGYGSSVSSSTLGGRLTLLLLKPAPLVLLLAGCFYLWVYIRYEPPSPGARREDEAGLRAAAAR